MNEIQLGVSDSVGESMCVSERTCVYEGDCVCVCACEWLMYVRLRACILLSLCTLCVTMRIYW